MPDDPPPTVSDPGSDPLATAAVGSEFESATPTNDTTATDVRTKPTVVSQSLAGYDLLEEIGRGGMGIVYRARDRALQRDVAIKILSHRYTVDSVAAQRFLHEAQITGQLQHPGIPAVHQVGTQPDGRPFLAMKLIQGQTLADQLKARTNLADDRARFVAVFEGLCQAVGYAHAHGVIHRDLKPANVMVGAFGEVQVMDWGLAKVMGRSSEATPAGDAQESTTDIPLRRGGDLATQAGSLLGTPAFMPPEQAIGAIDQIDEQSDVFGLGAVLCVILTGQPPYVGGDAESTRQLAARARLDDALRRLEQCGADPQLVALCQCCLASEKANRPRHAGELAEFVHLLRVEVEERAQKAEVTATAERTRRRVLTWAAAVVGGVLLAGVAGSSWQAFRAHTAQMAADQEATKARTAEGLATTAAILAQRREEEARQAETQAREREKAEQKARLTAEAVAEFMQEVFAQTSPEGQATPQRLVNPRLTVREAMDYAAKQVAGRFADRPEVEAALQYTIGKTYYELGLLPQAQNHLERAVAIRDEVLGPDHVDSLLAVNNLARVLREREDDRAEPLLKRALAGYERIHGPEHPHTLIILNGLGLIALRRGELELAERHFRRAIAGQEKGFPPDHPSTLTSLNNLALVLKDRGDYQAAEDLLRRVQAGFEKAHGPEHPATLVTLATLADVLERRKQYDRSEKLYQQALTGLEAGLGPDHPSTVNTLVSLAVLYQMKGEFDRAEPLLKRGVSASETLFGPNHDRTLSAQNNLAVLYFNTNRSAEAVPLFQRVIQGREQTLGPNHTTTLGVVNNLANLLETIGDLPAAEAMYRRAHQGWEKVHGPEHPTVVIIAANLADLYAATRKYDQAVPLFEQALKGYSQRPEMAAAVPLLQTDLGLALVALGQWSKAEPYLLAGHQALTRSRATAAPIRNRHRWVTQSLVAVYESMARPTKAAIWRTYLGTLPLEQVAPPRRRSGS